MYSIILDDIDISRVCLLHTVIFASHRFDSIGWEIDNSNAAYTANSRVFSNRITLKDTTATTSIPQHISHMVMMSSSRIVGLGFGSLVLLLMSSILPAFLSSCGPTSMCS